MNENVCSAMNQVVMQQELKQVAYLRNQAEAVGWAVKNKVTTPRSDLYNIQTEEGVPKVKMT